MPQEPVIAYPAEEIDPIIDDLTAQLSTAIKAASDAIKLAEAATREGDQLRAAIGDKDKAILEKVASAKDEAVKAATSGPDAEAIGSLVANLVRTHVVKAADATNFTKRLLESPTNVVKLATRLINLSHPAPSGGLGVEKQASIAEKDASTAGSDSDPDGWGEMIRIGA